MEQLRYTFFTIELLRYTFLTIELYLFLAEMSSEMTGDLSLLKPKSSDNTAHFFWGGRVGMIFSSCTEGPIDGIFHPVCPT